MSDQQNATQVESQQTTAPATDKKDANPNAAQTVVDNTQVNNETNPESKTAPLEGEELIKALVQQVEIIFSRENLMSDYNIVSKMNGDMCVNISVVLESPRISKLTTDASHLLTAMRQTNKVILDEATSTVKPSFKLQRNTIIIRDVAPDTPQEDLKNIFDNLKDKITSIHSDVGNTWFITFADEDTTTDAFLLSRGKQFQGKSVQARVKSENLLKSVYYQPPQTYQAQQSQQNSGFVANRTSTGQQNGAANGWWNSTNNTQRPPNSNYKGNNYNPNYKNTRYAGANPQGRGAHTGTRPTRDVAGTTTAPVATAAPTKRPSRSNSNASRPTKKPVNSNSPSLGSSDFPPLPSSAKKANGKEVQQWTKEEILAVVTGLTGIEKPEFTANLSDCPAIRESANTELDINKTLNVDLRLEVLEPKNKEAKRKRSRANSRKMSVGPGDNPYAQQHRNRSTSINNKPQPAAAAKQPVAGAVKPNEKENHSNNAEHAAETQHQEVKPKTTSATMSYADIARPSASPQPAPQRVQKESVDQHAQAAQQAKQQQQQQQQETKPRKQSDPNKFKRPKKTAKTNTSSTAKPSNTNAAPNKPAAAVQPKQAATTPAATKPVETATPSTVATEVNSSEATAVTNNA
jgi:hypothetical protein